MKPNRPPSEGLQFFAAGRIEAKTERLTVSIHDVDGKVVHTLDLDPAV